MRDDSVEAVLLYKVQFPSRGPVEKSGFPLESSGERGYLSVPETSVFILVKNVGLFPLAGATSNGMQ